MGRVLVTGGAGFIGSHLCDALLARGDDVTVVDDFSTGKDANLHAAGGRLRLIRDTVLNLHKYAEQLAGVERIYHLAALISGYESLQQPEPYLDINLRGMLRVIELAQANRARVIFTSSSTVYGNRPDGICRETDVARPWTVYAMSKIGGEHLLDVYSRLHGFSHVSLRLFNVYGPRQSPDHPYANVTCKFSRAAAEERPIQLFGTGKQSRDFVFVQDVVKAILLVHEKSNHIVYNVGTGSASAILTLISKLEHACGSKMRVEQMPPWPNDVEKVCADIALLRDEFGFEASVTLESGLRQTVEFFRQGLRQTAALPR
jgi:UDP-glucose 4-epimerase